MGARATRITRAEFLTPPEFLGVLPTQNPAGRVGGARIELIRSADRTRMGTCYQQIPVRLFPPFELDSEPAALLYLINLTAGLLDGDAHLIEITAKEGVRAVVTGQSATRIHPALESHATQQWVVKVEDDACLVVLPGPRDPVPGKPLLSARARRACPARPSDLGRHLVARPLRPRRAFGAIPVRADRPGLRGPPRRPLDLSRSVPMGWPLEPRGRQLVLRWGLGLR